MFRGVFGTKRFQRPNIVVCVHTRRQVYFSLGGQQSTRKLSLLNQGLLAFCERTLYGASREDSEDARRFDPLLFTLAQPRRIDVLARSLDIQYGWQLLYGHFVKVPRTPSLLLVERGNQVIIFKYICL